MRGWKEGNILLIFFCRGTFNVGGSGLVRSVLCTSLRLHIPCTYSLPTPHIYSTSNQRHISSFFTEIVNVLRPLATVTEELNRGSLTECLIGF